MTPHPTGLDLPTGSRWHLATLSRRGAPGVRPPSVQVPPAPENRRPLWSSATSLGGPTSSREETGLGKRRARQSSCHGPRPDPRSRVTRDAGLPQPSSSRGQTPPADAPRSPRCPLLEASAEGPGPPCSEPRGRAAPGPEAQPARTSGRLSPREAGGAPTAPTPRDAGPASPQKVLGAAPALGRPRRARGSPGRSPLPPPSSQQIPVGSGHLTAPTFVPCA